MSPKIRPEHLSRLAIVYIRQSTLAQVLEHRQSTERQYNLAELAKRFGWDAALVQIVDEDLAHSGASAADRAGFQKLVAEVSLGRVGAIFSLEVSRLARSSADWHRLLDLCALSNSLIIDDDGVYDPNDFNDRLVLGMKGTMSDAERHVMRLRLDGGRLHKARKGELAFPPPTGYVFDGGTLVLDPDEQVQRAVRLLFERFRIDGTAYAVVRYFLQHNLQFPSRHARKNGPAEIEWKRLTHSRVLDVLQNPLYTGAYVYGRRQSRRVLAEGAVRKTRETRLPRDRWTAMLPDSHSAYISWEQHMENMRRLDENRSGREALHRKGGPRRGEALLQGLALCGRCGRRMQTMYNGQRPYYQCSNHPHEEHSCWSTGAKNIDVKVAEIFLEAFAPSEIDLSFAVFKEVERQTEEVDRQWRLRLERARYETERAERQYNAVEPENRVVARTLETRWNEKLLELQQVERDYEEARHAKKLVLTPKDKKAILALAKDLPKVWRATTTTHADRKRILRLMIQDAVLSPVDLPERSTKIRLLWKTGAITEVMAPRPRLPSRTPEDVIDTIRQLAAQRLADIEIAEELNRRGIKSGRGRPFTLMAVKMIRSNYEIPAGRLPGGHLPSRDRDERGRYSVRGLAARYRVTDHIVRYWVAIGVLVPEREYRRGPMWFTITPQVDARIQKKKRNGRGPKAQKKPQKARSGQKQRAHHSKARRIKEA